MVSDVTQHCAMIKLFQQVRNSKAVNGRLSMSVSGCYLTINLLNFCLLSQQLLRGVYLTHDSNSFHMVVDWICVIHLHSKCFEWHF